ncbi:MAG TPA: LysR family transcriptional regulator [Rhizomicrobium sp.]|nr:LysR family transcriptional regulator [Rhizomicrobium sp.]
MPPSVKKRSARGKHWGVVAPPAIPDWEAAHAFLEVVRCGSFRAAALKLDQSVNALRRKVDAFESELGVPLLIRHINGVQPTEEGSKIYAAILQMENASFDVLQARNLSDKQIDGEVGLAISEGLGSAWLMPQLVHFQRANPKLAINLRCGQSPPDLLRLEADLSVQLERPKEHDLKVVKIGRLHMMLFAAKSYLDIHGHPASLADLAKHRVLILAGDKGRWEEDYRKFLPDLSPARTVALRNNVSSAHFSAIANAAGIGALPTYIQAMGGKLVPLHLGVNTAHDIWLTYRADAKRITRIRHTIEWIMQAFDPRRFPWFRDEFIHPDHLTEIYKGSPPENAVRDILVRS